MLPNSNNILLVEEQFCSCLPYTFCLSVILFLGACTTPPRLSVVTEFMEMGSLYHLIHVSGQKNNLSWQRRLKMICDICRYFQHKLCTQILIHSSSFPTNFFNFNYLFNDFVLGCSQNLGIKPRNVIHCV